MPGACQVKADSPGPLAYRLPNSSELLSFWEVYIRNPAGRKEALLFKRAVFLCGFSILLSAVIPGPSSAQNGKTIFGENKKETVTAMKQIAQSLGVRCVHCHVKKGGRIKYEIESPNKEIARLMKTSLMDSLAQKGRVEIKLVEEDHEMTITAVYRTQGDSTGIHLKALTAAGKTVQNVAPLPDKGAAIQCMTCHNGHLHIFTKATKKK